MEALEVWLRSEPSWMWIIAASAIIIAVELAMAIVLIISMDKKDTPPDVSSGMLWIGVVVGPLLEEFIFRAAPLWLAVMVFQTHLVAIMLVVFGTSAIFALMHHHRRLQIKICFGLGSAVYAILFLKYGGISGKFIVPFATIVIMHGLYNASIFAIATIDERLNTTAQLS